MAIENTTFAYQLSNKLMNRALRFQLMGVFWLLASGILMWIQPDSSSLLMVSLFTASLCLAIGTSTRSLSGAIKELVKLQQI